MQFDQRGKLSLVTGDTSVWPGESYPLGASYDGEGTNVALYSEIAERVELCLFGEDGEETRVDLREVDGFVWHGFLPPHLRGPLLTRGDYR